MPAASHPGYNRENMPIMQRNEILRWLRETDPGRLDDLWQMADRTRQDSVGGEVHLRGLIELSNHSSPCAATAACGRAISASSVSSVGRRVLGCVRQAVEFGYGTVVLQSGEDPELTCQRITGLIQRIKSETTLAVTLSLGERQRRRVGRFAPSRG